MTKKAKPQIVRQGDVLLIPVAQPTSGLTPVERDAGRVVLAYGEHTGHAHAILDDGVDLFDVADWEDRLLSVTNPAGADLVHEEHDTIHVPAGTYRRTIQSEYSPAEIRRTAD